MLFTPGRNVDEAIEDAVKLVTYRGLQTPEFTWAGARDVFKFPLVRVCVCILHQRSGPRLSERISSKSEADEAAARASSRLVPRRVRRPQVLTASDTQKLPDEDVTLVSVWTRLPVCFLRGNTHHACR